MARAGVAVERGDAAPGGTSHDAPAVTGRTPRFPAELAPASRAEVLALADQLTAIYKRGDWPALARLVAPDYLGSAPGMEWDFDELKAEFPKVRLVDCHVESSTVRRLAFGLVLLNQDAALKEFYGDQDISGRYRFTTIWARRQGGWRLIFEQEMPLPAPAASSASPARTTP